ncbi:MAG: proline--tRNA ligase [Pseudomonadota bacterium]
MRYSRALIPTLKEVPAEAQVPSHVFMIRGGYLRKVAAGIYSFLPLGWRVVTKIENIIREELNRAGAQEILMPAAIPAELWQESNRWQQYGPELLRFKDRKGADFVFGPTHEEVVVDLVRREVGSYRQLPVNLYQIQTKFRDEARPRAGLMRGREFIMKDAYSFHADEADAKREYQVMYDAYTRIFRRCGLTFRAVEADTGNIGGSLSHEFQVLAATGEDTIVSCSQCSYAANVEQAEVRRPSLASGHQPPPPDGGDGKHHRRERVATPGKRTVEEVASFLGVERSQLIKTLIYLADGRPVAALVRGDHDVNEIKLRRLCGAVEVALASDTAIVELTGGPLGFSGPIGLSGIRVVGDLEVRGMRNAVTGANSADAHYVGVDVERDLQGVEWSDLRTAAAGDRCPRCGEGTFQLFQGIEVGQVFFLGTKYSEPMGCTYLGDDGKLRPMVMGCYGIGVTRVAAAAIEQNHDEAGIIWPISIAPYQVEIVTAQANEPSVVKAGDRIHDELVAAGIEVLYDDRHERPGAKFKDADLLGIPLRVTVGTKSLAAGKVEIRTRRSQAVELVDIDRAAVLVAERVRSELAALQA